MTEEELKTLCKSLEERYSENSTIAIKQSDFNNMWASIDRYATENKRLQEKLAEANDTLIKSQNMKQPDRNNFVAQYLLKWGVK